MPNTPSPTSAAAFDLVHRPARGRHSVACWLSLPRERTLTQPPVVAIHGIQRGAQDIAHALAARAAAEGRAVIAPVFDEASWQGRGNGEGGPSVLGQGLNSVLNGYNGTFKFPFGSDPYKADIVWLGAFFGYNSQYMMGPWFANGFANLNVGNARTVKRNVSILGLGANLRAGYRYGQTPNDAISVDLLYTSGDANSISDDQYSGVLTGNVWGSPAALYISHGGYLLFPHANVVNRYISAVTDISNLGYGIAGGTLNLSKDFIPNKLQGKIGGATGWSMVAPAGGGHFMGAEANAKAVYQLGPFMSVELHGAYLWLGDFFDSQNVNSGLDQRPADPFTAFLAFRWLMF